MIINEYILDIYIYLIHGKYFVHFFTDEIYIYVSNIYLFIIIIII